MLNNIKKMWPLAAASLVFFTSSANAATHSLNKNAAPRNGSKSVSNGTGTIRSEGNPPVRPVLGPKASGVFMTGEYIYWKAVQDNLEYVATLNPGENCCEDQDNLFLDSYAAKLYTPKFQYKSGFKLGIGYNLPNDGWDIYFNWTRLTSNADGKQCASPCVFEDVSNVVPAMNMGFSPTTTNPCNGCDNCCDCQEPCCGCCDVEFDCGCPTALIPILGPRIGSDQYTTTTSSGAHWKLYLNMLDGELGRQFFVSRYLTIRPFFGMRGAWLHQKYQVAYESLVRVNDPVFFDTSLGSINACRTDCVKFKNYFTGTGPRFGFNTDWRLRYGLSIYANAAISLIWGQFDVKSTASSFLAGQLQSYNFTSDQLDDSVINECGQFKTSESFMSTKAITDLALGLKWNRNFMKDRLGLTIGLGWEQHLFFSQNQLDQLVVQTRTFPLMPVQTANLDFTNSLGSLTSTTRSISNRLCGDLSVQGLTLTVQLDF